MTGHTLMLGYATAIRIMGKNKNKKAVVPPPQLRLRSTHRPPTASRRSARTQGGQEPTSAQLEEEAPEQAQALLAGRASQEGNCRELRPHWKRPFQIGTFRSRRRSRGPKGSCLLRNPFGSWYSIYMYICTERERLGFGI